MEIIKVFRIQMYNNSINGFYHMKNGEYISKAAIEMNYDGLTIAHPMPYDDDRLIKHLDIKMYYGFKNINQLKDWLYMKKWRDILHEEGFEIRVYKALGVHGKKQSIFIKRNMIGRKYKISLNLI